MSEFYGEWYEGIPKNHTHRTPIFFSGLEAFESANQARVELMQRAGELPEPYNEVLDVVSSWLLLAVRGYDFRPFRTDTELRHPTITPHYLEGVFDSYVVLDTDPALYQAFEVAKNDALRSMVGAYLSGRRN